MYSPYPFAHLPQICYSKQEIWGLFGINKMTDIATEIKEARSRIADFERQRVKIAARSNSLRTQLGKIKRRLHQAPEQTQVEFEEYYRKKLSIIEELSQCEKTATAIKAEQQRLRMIADSVERQLFSLS